MGNTSAPSRIFCFDLLRIFLIAAVVHLHLHIITSNKTDMFSRFEYYAVPLFLTLSFFLTSKYFLNGAVSFEKIKPRMQRLLVPLVIWSLVGFLPHLNLLTLPNVVLQLLTGELVNPPLYYLNILILLSLLCYALTYVRLSWRMAVFLGCLVLAFALQYSGINYRFFAPYSVVIQRSYGRFFELLPYVMLGIAFAVHKARRPEAKENAHQLIGVMLVAVVGYIVATRIPVPKGFSYQGLMLFFGTITMFSAVLLATLLDNGKYVSSQLRDKVSQLGKYTFGIYLFHYPVLELLLPAVPALKNAAISHANIFLIAFLVVSFAACIVIDRVSRGKLAFLLR